MLWRNVCKRGRDNNSEFFKYWSQEENLWFLKTLLEGIFFHCIKSAYHCTSIVIIAHHESHLPSTIGFITIQNISHGVSHFSFFLHDLCLKHWNISVKRISSVQSKLLPSLDLTSSPDGSWVSLISTKSNPHFHPSVKVYFIGVTNFVSKAEYTTQCQHYLACPKPVNSLFKLISAWTA